MTSHRRIHGPAFFDYIMHGQVMGKNFLQQKPRTRHKTEFLE